MDFNRCSVLGEQKEGTEKKRKSKGALPVGQKKGGERT